VGTGESEAAAIPSATKMDGWHIEGQAGGEGLDDRRLARRALHGANDGINDAPLRAAPVVHVGNFREKDPPIFHGLPNEDVMEWSHQFQRVSLFNQWGPAQQLRHIEFSLEGVAARWLTGLHPRPETFDGLMGALQAAFRHHNYALELESQLRSRKMGPDEPVMSYCYDIIYLCSRVDPVMTEERKVQFIFQNMEPTLMQKVYPHMDRMDTVELFRRLQAHSQASLIAGRSIPVNQILPTPPASSKTEIEKLVREEVTKSLEPIVRELKEATRSLGAGGGSRGSRDGWKGRTGETRDNWRERTGEREQNPSSRQQDRPNKRTVDGRPICNACRKSGHIARSCPDRESKFRGNCFNCGEQGHLSRQCPKVKQEGGSKSEQKPAEPAKSEPSAGSSN
jgi:hypothetical protein